MTKLRFGGVALGVVALWMAVALGMSAGADTGFDNKDLRGTYGFSAAGSILVPIPSVCPVVSGSAAPPCAAVAVGVMAFDGVGGCTITDQLNIDGGVIPAAGFRTTAAPGGSCSYSVNADGTGTITAIFPGEPPVPLTMALVEGGDEFFFIRTDVGVASGQAKAQ